MTKSASLFHPTTLLLALLSSAFIATAQTDTNPPPAKPETPPAERPQNAPRLQQISGPSFTRVFTDEQRIQYREAMEANRKKMQALQTQLRDARKQLFDLQLAEKFDEAAYRTQAAAVAKIQTEMEVLNAQAFVKIRPSLTAEQIEKIKTPPMTGRGYGGPEARPGAFPPGAPAVPPGDHPIRKTPPMAQPLSAPVPPQ